MSAKRLELALEKLARCGEGRRQGDGADDTQGLMALLPAFFVMADASLLVTRAHVDALVAVDVQHPSQPDASAEHPTEFLRHLNCTVGTCFLGEYMMGAFGHGLGLEDELVTKVRQELAQSPPTDLEFPISSMSLSLAKLVGCLTAAGKDDPVLDVGTGCGIHAFLLQRTGFRSVLAIDSNERAVKLACACAGSAFA